MIGPSRSEQALDVDLASVIASLAIATSDENRLLQRIVIADRFQGECGNERTTAT
jgi:hypothetical protein